MTIETKPSAPKPQDASEHRPQEAGTPGSPTRSIIVNGRRHVVAATAINHAAVVELAFPRTGSASCAVAFREGPIERPEGLLVPGHGTALVEDQVFHVATAVQS
jgi:hypothetical protein